MLQRIFIGMMSGTSMDGVDGVIASFDVSGRPQLKTSAHLPFDETLRADLFALQTPGENEIAREAEAAGRLADVYARCCALLLEQAALHPSDICAIGVHGQTIRHRPERGWTRQTNDPAKLAEQSGIDVIADFRSRDIAAGGQGAPLVPAFHAQVFGAAGETRVICNIGGISNLSVLHGQEAASGFDCGPGNVLLDAWAEQTLGRPYDEDGKLAAAGQIDDALLSAMLAEPFFTQAPPKSTGRDLFNRNWLTSQLHKVVNLDRTDADVQATLTALSAHAIVQDIVRHAPDCRTLYVCGGGARNPILMGMLSDILRKTMAHAVSVETTDALGIDHQQVEALAFAWLAMRFTDRKAGNLPAVTGAAGPRVLGALYPR